MSDDGSWASPAAQPAGGGAPDRDRPAEPYAYDGTRPPGGGPESVNPYAPPEELRPPFAPGTPSTPGVPGTPGSGSAAPGGYAPGVAPFPGSPGQPGSMPPGASAPPWAVPDDPFAMDPHATQRALSGPGYYTPPIRNEPWSIVALVTGLVGVVIPGICLAAIITGHVSLVRQRTSYDGGRGMAMAGLVLGYAITALWLLALLLVAMVAAAFSS